MNFYDPYENSIKSNHIYVVENIPTNDTEQEFQEIFTEGCKCQNVCRFETCICLQKYGRNYNIINEGESFHTALRKLNYSLDKSKFNHGLYECNSSCKCVNKFCGNRLVQFGPRKNLEVRECSGNAKAKGMGLFTKEMISAGNFVCEYAGEIITKSEAVKRFKYNEENNLMNYIVCIREHFGSKIIITYIDPSYFGNIGRYANHSCNPNCELVPVRVDYSVPKLCIFARKDIGMNEEITFHYGKSNTASEDNKFKLRPCICGDKMCRKWLPYSLDVCS